MRAALAAGADINAATVGTTDDDVGGQTALTFGAMRENAETRDALRRWVFGHRRTRLPPVPPWESAPRPVGVVNIVGAT